MTAYFNFKAVVTNKSLLVADGHITAHFTTVSHHMSN